MVNDHRNMRNYCKGIFVEHINGGCMKFRAVFRFQFEEGRPTLMKLELGV
jgi:hypothetical protein